MFTKAILPLPLRNHAAELRGTSLIALHECPVGVRDGIPRFRANRTARSQSEQRLIGPYRRLCSGSVNAVHGQFGNFRVDVRNPVQPILKNPHVLLMRV